MDAKNLISYLKKKGQLQTDAEVAELLGVQAAHISQWQKGNGQISALQVANAILKAKVASKHAAHRSAIKPIVEFFPAECSWPKDDSSSAQVFFTDKTTTYKNGLKDVLKTTKFGLYMFYDSTGKALYVGQTQNNVWLEMNSAYNRIRSAQDFMLITHPNRNVSFKRADEKNRQHRPTNLKLFDIATYFSVYEVDENFVDNLEALLIRAFPNDLLNVKIQKIKPKK